MQSSFVVKKVVGLNVVHLLFLIIVFEQQSMAAQLTHAKKVSEYVSTMNVIFSGWMLLVLVLQLERVELLSCEIIEFVVLLALWFRQ